MSESIALSSSPSTNSVSCFLIRTFAMYAPIAKCFLIRLYGEVTEGDCIVLFVAQGRKPDDGLAGDGDGERDQVTCQRIVADVVLPGGGDAVDLVPEDLRVVAGQADVQAGPVGLRTVVLDCLARAAIVERVHNKAVPAQEFGRVRRGQLFGPR